MAPVDPSEREDEYFLKIEAEKLSKMRTELDQKREQEARQRRKETHWMKCPKCGTDLKEVNYEDVLIDTCSECHGIWLDHGELELLVSGQAHFTKRFFKKVFG